MMRANMEEYSIGTEKKEEYIFEYTVYWKDDFNILRTSWHAKILYNFADAKEFAKGKKLKSIPLKPYIIKKPVLRKLLKKDVEVEQDRDVETKINTIVLATYYICALVNNNKICKIVKA